MASKRRIVALDELRGFCVLLMLFFHAFYTLGFLFDIEFFEKAFWFFNPVEPIFAGIFVGICGYCCSLSSGNYRRGGILVAVSSALSLFLYVFMPENMIWFGVLHMLACCILLYALTARGTSHLPPLLMTVICAVLFALSWGVPDGGYFGLRGVWTVPVPHGDFWLLYPLGFGRQIEAGDYFPLVPWIFLFFAGAFFGRWRDRHERPNWMYRSHIPAFSWLGRHALLIYVAHQPVIYGIAFAADYLIKKIG